MCTSLALKRDCSHRPNLTMFSFWRSAPNMVQSSRLRNLWCELRACAAGSASVTGVCWGQREGGRGRGCRGGGGRGAGGCAGAAPGGRPRGPGDQVPLPQAGGAPRPPAVLLHAPGPPPTLPSPTFPISPPPPHPHLSSPPHPTHAHRRQFRGTLEGMPAVHETEHLHAAEPF